MITETIDKRTANLMIKGKLPVFIPAIIIGTSGGIFYATSAVNISMTLMLGVVAPFSLIFGCLAAYVGASLGANNMIGSTFKLTDNELILEKENGSKKINTEEIKSAKENIWGLKVSGKSTSIWIPKQLSNYSEFNNKIKDLCS